jgi:LacI family transcriptional regulator
MEKKETTIYDIAKALNISPSTVSRGLSNHPAINAKTKNKILKSAQSMGYQSNKFASSLRKKRTNTIGVIIPRLDSLFMSSVIAGIEKVVNTAGYNLIISQSLESEKKEKSNAVIMFNSRVDGLIVSLSNETKDYSHFETFIDKNIPLIFFDRIAEELPSTKVIIDNQKAGYIATKHLIDQGCRKILHITSNVHRNVYRDRFEGYKKALMENNLPFEEDLFIMNDLSETAIVNSIKAIFVDHNGERPDGIFLTSDSAAAIALTTLRDNGIRVPEDVAIIGFNNDIISKVTEPAISTINYPGNDMGESVARILLNHLNGDGNLNITSTVVLNTELIVRNSTVRKG